MGKPRTKPGIHQRTYRGKVMRLLEGSTEFAAHVEEQMDLWPPNQYVTPAYLLRLCELRLKGPQWSGP